LGIQLDKFSFGVSNENIWWGPGQRNALMFTNNAAGFMHAYFQTNKPIKTKIGNFEFNEILSSFSLPSRSNFLSQRISTIVAFLSV
jgi:hypothetical protein